MSSIKQGDSNNNTKNTKPLKTTKKRRQQSGKFANDLLTSHKAKMGMIISTDSPIIPMKPTSLLNSNKKTETNSHPNIPNSSNTSSRLLDPEANNSSTITTNSIEFGNVLSQTNNILHNPYDTFALYDNSRYVPSNPSSNVHTPAKKFPQSYAFPDIPSVSNTSEAQTLSNGMLYTDPIDFSRRNSCANTLNVPTGIDSPQITPYNPPISLFTNTSWVSDQCTTTHQNPLNLSSTTTVALPEVPSLIPQITPINGNVDSRSVPTCTPSISPSNIATSNTDSNSCLTAPASSPSNISVAYDNDSLQSNPASPRNLQVLSNITNRSNATGNNELPDPSSDQEHEDEDVVINSNSESDNESVFANILTPGNMPKSNALQIISFHIYNDKNELG